MTLFVCHTVDPNLGVEKRGQQNKGAFDFEIGDWSTGCTLAPGVQINLKQSLFISLFVCVCVRVCVCVCACACLCVWQKGIAFKFSLDLHFYVLDSLNMLRYSSESKNRYTPRLMSTVDYGFDQWSVVCFVVNKLCVYLIMVKQHIFSYTEVLHANIFSPFMIWE